MPIEPWNDDVEPTYYEIDAEPEPHSSYACACARGSVDNPLVWACVKVAAWIGLTVACATLWYVVIETIRGFTLH